MSSRSALQSGNDRSAGEHVSSATVYACVHADDDGPIISEHRSACVVFGIPGFFFLPRMGCIMHRAVPSLVWIKGPRMC